MEYKFFTTMCCAILSTFLCFAQPKEGSQIFNFNDKDVHIYTKGIQHRQPGQPVLIFESALGIPLENWYGLFDKMQDSLPVFAYDRAGIGKSEFTNNAPTPEFVASRLHNILKQLDISPPYVLVAHSWGGPLINSFAVQFPDDVAGMVFIDTSDIINRNETYLQAIKIASNGKVTTNVIQEKMNEAINRLPPSFKTEWEVVNNLTNDEKLDPNRFTPKIVVPTAILVGPRYDPAPVDLGVTEFDLKDFYSEAMKLTIMKKQEIVRGNPHGLFLVVNNIGHLMHAENPELIANIVEEIYRMSSK
ncbi:alpha/beta fold hydrolase [Aegicerativicinus sediminis]|uniref:alpha/beta fold hydrolase n=1 Tax=Aegicerativicinus sediminis TaxID=2893202 RepID=UPI001E3FDBFF|nr:alpha/beta hydrolase [Aegicerativicinus sediminis]